MQDHRKPPKPPHYFTAEPGQCKFCGEMVLKKDGAVNKRANWHPPCVAEYKIIYWPAATRKAVWKRDKGICVVCSKNCGRHAWDVEHTRPLYEANGDIEFWKMSNTTTYCKDCHKEKSAREAGERAAARRAAKENKDA